MVFSFPALSLFDGHCILVEWEVEVSVGERKSVNKEGFSSGDCCSVANTAARAD